MILVTGSTGFLGRFIVDELLKANIAVRALVRNPAKAKFMPSPLLEIVEGDILDILSLEKAMEGCEAVIHSAASISFWKRKASEMKRVNVNGTANVVDLARELGLKKLVHISSIAALGRTKSKGRQDETEKWKDSQFNSNYAKSKHLAELEVYRGIEEGLPAVILNPGVIMGPGDWTSGTPIMFDKISRGFKWSPNGFTGFVSVRDVARAALVALKSDFENGERFILVGENKNYKDVFNLIAKSLGVTTKFRIPPSSLVKIAGFFSEILGNLTGKEPIVTRETTRNFGFHYEYDGTKITRLTDFRYSSLEDIIKETAEIYKAEHGTTR